MQIPLRRKLAYTAVLMIVALALGEAAVRLRQWMLYGNADVDLRDALLVHDKEADLFVPRPGHELKGEKIRIRINRLGFRGDEITREKPAGTIRIVCLGASTTFNAEVSTNEATWPHRLQERLERAHPGVRFEVINAAVGGYIASTSLKNLRHRVLPIEPDLVIYYEAHNDIVRDTQELALRAGIVDEGDGGRFGGGPPLLSKHSRLFDLLYKNTVILARSRMASTRRIDRVPPDLPNRFIGVLDEMRRELASRNVPFVLSTFVTKYRRDQDRRTQTANAAISFYYMPWMSIDGMLDAVDVYNRAILAFAARERLPVVDARESIPPTDDHFSDSIHFLDKGADAMAGRVFAYLQDSGLIDRVRARVEPTEARR